MLRQGKAPRGVKGGAKRRRRIGPVNLKPAAWLKIGSLIPRRNYASKIAHKISIIIDIYRGSGMLHEARMAGLSSFQSRTLSRF